MKENDFIGQMVQETIHSGEDKSNILSFSQENSFELNALYDDVRKCYILSNKQEDIEIPENWGPFKNRISTEFIVSRFDDKDFFLDTISLFYGKELSSVKILLENASSKLSDKSAA